MRVSQTTGSWISELPAGGVPATHWVTGTSAPCLSIRKPTWFDAVSSAGLPDLGPAPTGTTTPGSLWWDHEDVHRTVLRDYARLRALIAGDRSQTQARIDAAASLAAAASVEDRVECTRAAFAMAREAEERWRRIVLEAAPTRTGVSPYQRAWRGFDRAAGRI